MTARLPGMIETIDSPTSSTIISGRLIQFSAAM
jgi:hypothetical protein